MYYFVFLSQFQDCFKIILNIVFYIQHKKTIKFTRFRENIIKLTKWLSVYICRRFHNIALKDCVTTTTYRRRREEKKFFCHGIVEKEYRISHEVLLSLKGPIVVRQHRVCRECV